MINNMHASVKNWMCDWMCDVWWRINSTFNPLFPSVAFCYSKSDTRSNRLL